MTALLTQEALDALHPFAFETDQTGIIVRVGRSLRKLFPEVVEPQLWSDLFELVQPSPQASNDSLFALVGEVITVVNKRDSRLRLRGQVVCNDDNRARYMFSLTPSLWRAEQLQELGLDITDFEVGTIIFDFLVYAQAQKQARDKAAQARGRLEWDAKIGKLLHQISLETYSATSRREAYHITISSVCKTLDWEVGHVLERVGYGSQYLASSGLWYISDEEAYKELRAASEGCFFSDGEGLPGKVLETSKVVWLHDATSDPIFFRRKTIQKLSRVSAIAVPIMVQGRIEAIVEFFTRKNAVEQETSYQFFQLLGIQLSRLMDRLESQQKEREQLALLAQSAKMATLGEIAAGIAHEINNPVSTISLVGHIIKRLAQNGSVSNEDLSPQLDRLELCVKRIAKIVSELRSFSRDTPVDGFQSVSLKALVEETLDLCHARFAHGNIALRVLDIDPSWSAECRGVQISQVLLNLLSNAYDAVVGMGSAWIELSVADRGANYEIAVTDSGMGIPESIAANMMQPFYTTKPLGKGTGLGLSISSNIMIDHRGSLSLDRSSVHTRFVVKLPKSQSPQHQEELRAIG